MTAVRVTEMREEDFPEHWKQPNMRLLVCGDRNWYDVPAIRGRVQNFKDFNHLPAAYESVTVVHGAAPGADKMAGVVAQEMGLVVEAYPADWAKYGKAAGPIRNQQMLDTGIDVVYAFHDDIEHSKGTKDMLERAKKDKQVQQVVLFSHGLNPTFLKG